MKKDLEGSNEAPGNTEQRSAEPSAQGALTRKQQLNFLKQEKWHFKYLGSKLIKVIDPVLGDGYYLSGLATPYRIALERKASRDLRNLKRAGWTYGSGMGSYKWTKDLQNFYTKAQAVSTLKADP